MKTCCSYSYLEDNVRGAEDGPSTKGGMTFIVEKVFKYLKLPILTVYSSLKNLNFTRPFCIINNYSLLIFQIDVYIWRSYFFRIK